MLVTFFELSDVSSSPRVRTELPLLRIGDKINLRFCLERQHLGRREVLNVSGKYQVTSMKLDLSQGRSKQIVSVSAIGKVPTWKAVRNLPGRQLSSPKFPRTKIE